MTRSLGLGGSFEATGDEGVLRRGAMSTQWCPSGGSWFIHLPSIAPTSQHLAKPFALLHPTLCLSCCPRLTCISRYFIPHRPLVSPGRRQSSAPSDHSPPLSTPIMAQSAATAPPTSSFNRMAISTIAPSACDTVLPPMRLFSRRSVSPASSDSDSRGNSIPVADTGIHPHLSSDVSGLHQADATIVPSSSSNGRQAPNGLTTPNPSSAAPSAKAKGKGRAKDAPTGDWLQPPGRKLCFRHQRMADEGTNLQLQKVRLIP